MFPYLPSGGLGRLDHVSELGIKSDGNGSSNGVRDMPGMGHFSLTPAAMHGAGVNAGMWFIEDGYLGDGGSTIQVIHLLHPFDPGAISPTDVTSRPVGIDAPYEPVADALDIDGTATPIPLADGGDVGIRSRFYWAAWRTIGDTVHLVSANTVGSTDPTTLAYSTVAHWYDIDVTVPDSPVLLQSGLVNPYPGATDTFMPSVDIATDGTIAMNFLQSTVKSLLADGYPNPEFPNGQHASMYVTVHRPSDPTNYMAPAMMARASPDLWGDPRIGDYSAMSIDPADGTFWAVNEYSICYANHIWGTWIQHFEAPTSTLAAPQLSSGDDKGSGRTNNRLPTFSGTTTAGAMVKLYDGGILVNQVAADGSGNWMITIQNPWLTTSTHYITVVVTDTSGNIALSSIAIVKLYALGDVNLDNHRGSSDESALETALTDLNAYYTANNLTSTEALLILDVNEDGVVDNHDIDALENLLSSGHGY